MKSAVMSSYKNNNKGINSTNLVSNLFKKTLLVAVMVTAHQSAFAGYKSLTSEEMGEVTGQAGLTVDLDAEAREAAQKVSDFQSSSMPLAVGTGNLALGTVAATTGGLMGLTSAGKYAEEIWSVDFVEEGQDASNLLSLWGADADFPQSETFFEITNIGDHGEVEQSLDTGDMLIHSGKSVHGVGSSEGIEFTVNRSLISGSSNSDLYGDINEKVRWGEWDLIFDVDKKNINVNVYLEAERDTVLDYLGMRVNVKVHNSRGDDQYIVETGDGTRASFAHFQADIGSNAHLEKGGAYFNILDFSGDVDYGNVTFGGGPAIGSVYITDFVIQANMDIYEH